MGLIEEHIKELRIMNQQFMAKKITPEEVALRVGISSQIVKSADLMVKVWALGAKYGPKTITKIERSNLIGEGSYIDLGTDVDMDTIKCPDLDAVITREKCLDYSGEKEHMESCSTCDQFNITRRLLMPVASNGGK